jgi:hypothetical protein
MKKYILLIFIFLFIFLGIFNIGYSGIAFFLKEKLPDSLQLVLFSIFKNEITNKRVQNDANEVFLPNTQTVNLKFQKILITDLKDFNSTGYGVNERKKKTFYIESDKNNIFILSKKGEILFKKIKNLENINIKFNKISNNIDGQGIRALDFFVIQNELFVSLVEKKHDNCELLVLKKSMINLENMKFVDIFKSNECQNTGSIQSGKIKNITIKSKNYILLTTNIDETANDNKQYFVSNAQKDNSIFGKILLIDEKNHTSKILTKGHRNILGLYVNQEKGLILATENGPRSGDEINKIIDGKNYGWNISSYGEKYGSKSLNYIDPDYKKNHEKLSYEEPIFSFVPSIAPTEIIKIDNSFSNLWEDNFLMGSLISKTLYRIKFDRKFSRIIFIEKIFVGERIRDLLYLKDEKKILLSLEDTGSLGILSLHSSH